MKRQYILLMTIYNMYTYQAVCIKPVADLVGEPLASLEHYAQLPWDFAQTPGSCPRMEQLLFNETVLVTKEQQEQLCIKVPDHIYATPQGNGLFWIAKNAVRPISKEWMLHIPRYSMRKSTYQNHVVTLLTPFTDPKLAITYSMGTNFVVADTPENGTITRVWRYNPARKRPELLEIPTANILDLTVVRSNTHKRQLMISIARKLIATPGYVPYVWGGSSYTHHYPLLQWQTTNSTLPNYPGSVRTLVDGNNQPIMPPQKIGCDCSGLIRRLCRMVGIPLYAKNSSTMKLMLNPLGPTHTVQVGDIIYLKGHVMMVSDVEAGKLIEARGALHGYGYIQEIPLAEEFEGINSYAQLVEAYRTKTPIKRLDKAGKVIGEYEITLLQLPTQQATKTKNPLSSEKEIE